LEEPLLEIDCILVDYAKTNKMVFSNASPEVPSRSLTWDKKIRKKIQIFLEDDEKMTYNFWIVAIQDRGGKRYWKNALLKDNVDFIEIKNNLKQLLDEGRNILDSWSEDDLEYGTDLKG
jgi:hypothetical protein